jgi:3-oxoacyl-[acyl-carrier protein] reductase
VSRPTVLVSGAASGIGEACVAKFASEGWDVFAWDINACETGDARCSIVDVSDFQGMKRAVLALPPIDVAINSAGIAVRKRAVALSQDEWDAVVRVNLSGAFYFSKLLHRSLATTRGVLVHLGSVTAHRTLRDRAAYSATKAGVASLARTLAIEWADDGIRVFSVSPTFVDSPLIQSGIASGEISWAAIVDQTPQKRFLTANEVAVAIFHLSSPHFPAMTGSDVLLDGGFTAYGGF